MINRLVIENLKHRWVRTLLAALVIGVQVMSILTLIGLSRGLLKESADRAKGSGADIFLFPSKQGMFSLSSGQINQGFIPFLLKQPHITDAVGILSAGLPGQIFTKLNGLDFPAFEKLNGHIPFLAGRPPTGPNDLVVDSAYARQNHLHVGDTVKLLNHNWRLSGIIAGGVLGRLIVPLTTLQQLTGNYNPPRLTEILVKLDNSNRTDAEVTALNELLKGDLQVVSTADFVATFNLNNIPALQAFIGVITTIAVVVGFLVVFLSMYTAVVERTREIGILKALGAKPAIILKILVREAVLLAVAGFIFGIILFFFAQACIAVFIPATLAVVNVPEWYPIAGGIAVLGALLGAIYPGLKAARQDAIEALAYE